jgi:hypothetical protein
LAIDASSTDVAEKAAHEPQLPWLFTSPIHLLWFAVLGTLL